MDVGPVLIRVVVGGPLAAYGAQRLVGWQPVPHDNAGDRGAVDPRPR